MAARKKIEPRRIECSEDTMRIFNRIATRMREMRDQVAEELKAEGVTIVKKGAVEVKLEPFSGCASIELRNWIIEVKGEKK